MSEQTLVLVKPDGIKKKLIGEIIKKYEDKGLSIVNIKMVYPMKEQVEEHYMEHKDKPYFQELVHFLMSERICAMIVTGENAVSKIRKINGKTDPLEAEAGSIRGAYGESIRHNIVHASDSPINAIREIDIWFPKDIPTVESNKTLSFTLSDKENEELMKFNKHHYEQCGKKYRYDIIFSPSGIGAGITIECKCCGEKKDITNVTSW